jgi:hypothetical protein
VKNVLSSFVMIPLSNNTGSRWIVDISEDLEEELMEKLRH